MEVDLSVAEECARTTIQKDKLQHLLLAYELLSRAYRQA